MYYYQETTESGSFAQPFPDDYETAETMAELKAAFRYWLSEVRRLSDEPVCLVVFKGEPEGAYPCDTYPDFLITSGPRDGMRIEPC